MWLHYVPVTYKGTYLRAKKQFRLFQKLCDSTRIHDCKRLLKSYLVEYHQKIELEQIKGEEKEILKKKNFSKISCGLTVGHQTSSNFVANFFFIAYII